MNRKSIDDLFARLGRFRKRLADKTGATMQWEAKAENGSAQQVSVSGVKDFDTLADDVATAFVWIWSMKDPMKQYSIEKGRSARWLEVQIDHDPCLSVCADLANEGKHSSGYARGSRSGKYPKLDTITISIPGEAIGALTVGDTWTHTHVAKAEAVSYTLPILDREDRTIGDAFFFLELGIQRWEELLTQIDA